MGKSSDKVAWRLDKIYALGMLSWPQLLQVNPESEFKGALQKLANWHCVIIHHGELSIHRDQGIVEHWNQVLAELLFLNPSFTA